jgi:oligopeptide/dipeptide ABC transporter ATP-binding protein
MKADVPLLMVEGLEVRHHSQGGAVNALNGVSFQVARGQTIGLVGESGCGKSTLAKTIVGLHRAAAGRILFSGADITPRGLFRQKTRRRAVTRKLQMVFQDPLTSLNPRSSIGRIIEEPLIVHRLGNWTERKQRVAELLAQVGLSPRDAERMPHEFSGGQRQRVGIARALALTPELIICDEPVSALDLSVQAQVLNLLSDLQARHDLSYLFISHDLNVVRHMADRVMVMYLGRIVESGPAAALWDAPRHPYTQTLLAAVAGNRARRSSAPAVAFSELPSPFEQQTGCVFQARCPMRQAQCAVVAPALRPTGPGKFAACHFV